MPAEPPDAEPPDAEPPDDELPDTEPPATTGRVLVVGDLVTDVLAVVTAPLAGGAGLAVGSDTRARIRFAAGGSAANTASWLADARIPVTLVAAVGDDAAGRDRVAELTAAGVRCVVDRRPGAGTGTVVVLSDATERTMLCDRGANHELTSAHVSAAVAGAADAVHLHLSAYPLFDPGSRPAARTALFEARRAGLTTSVDAASAGPLREAGPAAFRDWLGRVDLLLANLDEARVLLDDPAAAPVDAARRLRDLADRVVVKLGAHGAVWADGDGTRTAKAVPARAVDPTGAGDAFAAGLLAARVSGGSPDEALARATAFGARAVGRLGARPDGTEGGGQES